MPKPKAKNPPRERPVTIVLKSPVLEQFETQAEKEQRTRANLAQIIIKQYYEAREQSEDYKAA